MLKVEPVIGVRVAFDGDGMFLLMKGASKNGRVELSGAVEDKEPGCP